MLKHTLRMTLMAATGVLLASTALGTAVAADREVHVFNWSDYIDPSILTDFTKETGIKVVYDVYDSNDILETKLLAGNSGYDVVVPSAHVAIREIQAGAFQKLDKSKLPNLKNAWPWVVDKISKYDPGNQYLVDYMWATAGIGYDTAKIKKIMPDAPLDSLKLVFDPAVVSKFKGCGVNILDASDEVLPLALVYLGKNPLSKDPKDIEAAGQMLAKIRPYVKTVDSAAYINNLANGDICLTIGWAGDILIAQGRAADAKNGVDVGYSIPKEGTDAFFDTMAIPKDAKNVAEAHEFINYILRPEVVAKASNKVSYASGNLPAQKLVDPALFANPNVYPPEDVLKRLYALDPLPATLQKVETRVWTKFKTGK